MRISQCKPLVLYLILNSIPYIIFILISLFNLKSAPGYKAPSLSVRITRFIFGSVMFMLTSVLLYFLCSLGLSSIAWIIVLLPFIVGIFLLGVFITLGKKMKNKK